MDLDQTEDVTTLERFADRALKHGAAVIDVR
jgi:hypothetical protein